MKAQALVCGLLVLAACNSNNLGGQPLDPLAGGDPNSAGGTGGVAGGDTTPQAVGDSMPPADLDTVPRGVQAVSAGLEHTCAIAENGGMYCFGVNNVGQLGRGLASGTRTPFPTPSRVGSDTWSTVQGMAFGTCGLSSAGVAHCWGGNADGQLGVGKNGVQLTTQPSPRPVNDHFNYGALWADWLHVFAQDGDTAYCWGMNIFGQLAQGTSGYGFDVLAPKAFAAANQFTTPWAEMTIGHYHTCGITQGDGKLYCFGSYDYGQLGDGRHGDGNDHMRNPVYIVKDAPQAVSDDAWLHVAALEHATCAIKADGTLWCWGSHQHGQLGLGEDVSGRPGCAGPQQVKGPDNQTRDFPAYCGTPQQVDNDTTWQTLEAGTAHVCAIRRDASLWCWGYDEYGQVGNGAHGDDNAYNGYLITPTPYQVTGKYRAVSAGGTHTCAIDTAGALWCWGGSTVGQASTTDKYVLSPVQVGL